MQKYRNSQRAAQLSAKHYTSTLLSFYTHSMRILGIETSCDETAAAVVEDGTRVLSNVIASSKETFENAGGVIPEEAAREQVQCILPVIEQAMEGIDLSTIDAIAVTKGPGLLGSLLVGTTAARTLALLWKKPLIGVHHTLGHLSSSFLSVEDTPQFPLLTLSVSGGHTELWYRESHTNGVRIAQTRDDAAGEAFDKGATMLGLPYPGGPALAALADQGNAKAIKFTEPLKGEDIPDWSFSGLKTALKYHLRDHPNDSHADIAASFQEAICTHLLSRVTKAIETYECKEVHVVGGVSANRRLRTLLRDALGADITLRWPMDPTFCTDNAAMIAAAGTFLLLEQQKSACDAFETQANTPLTQVAQH